MVRPRPQLQQAIERAGTRRRVVALIGPRQCGKTALARQFVPADALNYFDLEDLISLARRRNFIQTFLERELLQLGVSIPAASMFRFWHMLAEYHGQVWNAAEIARALAVSESTVRRYLDLLEGAFTVRQLRPWFANLGKRQVKSPLTHLARGSQALNTELHA